MFKKVTLITLLSIFAVMAYATPWMSHNSRRAPKTLVVVGNYRTPRLMAATIKALTSQPYLVIAEDGRYFMTLSKATVPVSADKLDVYINQLNPRRVVIIGDERFVSAKQEQKLRTINTKRIPILRIYGGDWGRIAEELDDLLNIGNLSREFRRNYYKLSMSDPRLSESASQSETVQKNDSAKEAFAAEEDEAPAAEPQELSAN